MIPVWLKGYTGKGSVVTVVDDGIEYTHPDLRANYDASASWDMNGNDPDPFPNEADPINSHGTRCCGQIAMVANNSWCGVGIAFKASIGAVRMLDGDVTDAIEARSLSLNYNHVQIYTNSWGPNDDGATMEGPGPLAELAFEKGASQGRNNLGSIFLFANGNGGRQHDNCNADGYSNSIFTIAIGAIAVDGSSPWYTEQCSATMAVTYSSGSYGQPAISTVDLHSGCTNDHTGTSAASPEAAGILALVLEARPNITWRDMQHLIAHSAQYTWRQDPDWTNNRAGFHINHKFGFGRLDATKIVELAETWVPVGAWLSSDSPTLRVSKRIPYAYKRESALHETYVVTASMTDVQELEHVQVTINADCDRRGDYYIELLCPSGTSSILMTVRPYDFSPDGIHWTFMTVRCWGENPVGTWHLYISNQYSATDSGTLNDWQITFYGNQGQAPQCGVGLFRDGNGDCLACDEQCGENGCTGGGPGACRSCKNFISNGLCIDNCTSHGKLAVPGSQVCVNCHPQCNNCTGPTAFDCITCMHDSEHFPNGTECTTGCRQSEYPDSNGVCQSCDPECVGGCSGPGPSLCVKCAHFIADNHTCVAKCPTGTYSTLNATQYCQPCSPLCSASGCTGMGPLHCIACLNYTLQLPGMRECVSKCPLGQTANPNTGVCNCTVGTYRDQESLACLPCSTKCAPNTACSGPDVSSCLEACAGLQHGRDCVSSCPLLTYPTPVTTATWSEFYPNIPLISDSGCLPCDSQCASGCTGPTASDCINGTNGLCVASFVAGVCVSQCPENEYTSSNGLCLPCDSECIGCMGEGPGACIECAHVRFNSTCLATCPTHTYVGAGSVCLHCNLECAESCVGPNNDQCHAVDSSVVSCTHFTLYTSKGGSICVPSCPDGYISSSDSKICRPCDALCLDRCHGLTASDCESCLFASLPNGTCVASCPVGYFAADNVCMVSDRCCCCSENLLSRETNEIYYKLTFSIYKYIIYIESSLFLPTPLYLSSFWYFFHQN